jgi:hypothetical protein
MKIFIKAKPNAKTESIEELKRIPGIADSKKAGIPTFKVTVKATPTDGKANDAVVRVVAAHFNISRARVRIISGHTTNQKIVEIDQ